MKKILIAALAALAPVAAYAGTYTFTDTSSNVEDMAHGTAYTWGLTTTMAGSTGANLAALETAIQHSGQTVTSATLTLTSIWDWTAEPGDVLYVNVLNGVENSPTSNNLYEYNSNPATTDSSFTGQTDPFVIGTTNYSATHSHLSFTGVAATGSSVGNSQGYSLLTEHDSRVGGNPLPSNESANPGTWGQTNGGASSDAVTVVNTFSANNLALLNQILGSDTIGSSTNLGLGFGPDCHFYDSGVTLTITTGTRSVPDGGMTVAMLGFGIIGLAALGRSTKRSRSAV